MSIKLTPLALKNIKRLQTELNSEGYGLRFGLTGGGCSGYKYIIEFENMPEQDDNIYEVVDENYKIDIYVSNTHVDKLKNSTIDWVETLMEAGFKIDNPQAKQPCGCGESINF